MYMRCVNFREGVCRDMKILCNEYFTPESWVHDDLGKILKMQRIRYINQM